MFNKKIVLVLIIYFLFFVNTLNNNVFSQTYFICQKGNISWSCNNCGYYTYSCSSLGQCITHRHLLYPNICYDECQCNEFTFWGKQPVQCGALAGSCDVTGRWSCQDVLKNISTTVIFPPYYCDIKIDPGSNFTNLNIDAQPSIRSIYQGEDTLYQVNLIPLNFSGQVNLSVSGCPLSVRCIFENSSFNLSSNQSTSTFLLISNTINASPANYNLNIIASAVSKTIISTSTSVTLQIMPSPQTLFVSLSANPPSGKAPLTTILTADVSGTSQGTINYTFWKNCNSTSTSIQQTISQCGQPDAKYDNQNKTTFQVPFTYSTPGTYTPKVIVERGTANPAEAKTSVVVYTPGVTPSFNLDVSIAGTGSGRVTSNPPGIDCNPNCSAAFVSGTSVTLQATPLSGFQFNRWSGDCSGTSLSCVLTMNADKSVTANFVSSPPPPPPQTHLECNNQNQCVSVPGPGPDRCSTPRDCGFGGSNFAGKCQTQIINGLPVDYCADKECDPSIPGDCQSECRYDEDCGGPPGSSHLVCYNNACVIVGGPGQDNCSRIGQGCRPRIQEIIPLNPMPLDKFLKQVAGVWFIIFK